MLDFCPLLAHYFERTEALRQSRELLGNFKLTLSVNLVAKIGFDTAENEPSEIWPASVPTRPRSVEDL